MTAWVAVLAAVAGIGLLELLAFMLYTKKAPVHRKRVLEYLLYRRVRPWTAASQPISQGAVSRYSEHPFTAWSLNPDYLNIHGERIHNRQGFRCSKDFEYLDRGALRIYCAGGSSTYCTDVERNEDSWPELLGQYLEQLTGRKVEVINGGVGSFNTFQSYIRLSAYIKYLRPDLVIVYHAKNDLYPFYHGDPKVIGAVLPDLSNCMRSLSFRGIVDQVNPLARWSYLGKLWAVWALNHTMWSLSYVFKSNSSSEQDTAILLAARTDYSIIENMQKNMVALCAGNEVPLLYMTQRVEDPIFTPYIQEINARIRSLEKPAESCFVFDLDRALPYEAGLLVDKIHFSHAGCKRVAEHIGDFILSQGILERMDKRVATSGSNA
jgi:hypothetical protein